jgi:hypothetical protein
MGKIISGLLSLVVLGLAARATAEPISPFSVGPGHSWVVSWDDTSDGASVDQIIAKVVSGPSDFDEPISITLGGFPLAGWTSTLVNEEETKMSGAAINVDKDISLSFGGTAPAGGVVVDVFELYNGRTAAYGSFQWEDLPSQGNWINLPANTPIPDGGLTASMLGLGFLGLCYVSRLVK